VDVNDPGSNFANISCDLKRSRRAEFPLPVPASCNRQTLRPTYPTCFRRNKLQDFRVQTISILVRSQFNNKPLHPPHFKIADYVQYTHGFNVPVRR
jgi:hypothetical protein